MTGIEPTEADIEAATAMCAKNEAQPSNFAPYDFLIDDIAQAIAKARLQERERTAVICETYIGCGAIAREIRSQS